MIYPLDAVSVVCFIILIAKRQELNAFEFTTLG